MKKVILSLSVLFFVGQAFAQLGTGLNPPSKSANKFKQKNSSSLGFSGTLPASYSMKSYTPYPKSQGSYSTCASWATAYSAMTTQYAYSMKITNRNVITSLAFCPYYTHNNSKTVTDACASGNGFYEITQWLIENGTKKFYLPLINCATTNDKYMSDGAKNYRIKEAYQSYSFSEDFNEDETGFRTFFNKTTPFNIDDVKKLLASNIVPIFAMYVPPSFHDLTGKSVWDLSSEEKADPAKVQSSNMNYQHARHAMTIVSYDDKKYGGAFEIMNSWGSSFGDNGYIWVRYADLQKYVYQIIFLDFYPAPTTTATTGCLYGDCNNGYGIAKFDNGDMYEGFFTNGQYDGYGVYAWASGATYDGAWKAGARDGDATFYYSDGSYGGVNYSGDKFQSGYAKITYESGNSFEGMMKNGTFSGYGRFKFASGDVYEGNFANGDYDGLGKYTFASGTVHIGYFSAGQYHGKGIEVSSSGQVWGGIWAYDKFTTGKKYGFSNNARPSFTELVPSANTNYVDASCTSGDCLNGKGERKYNNGTIYEGEFKDGVESGVGKKFFSDGSSLETFFAEGSYFGAAVLKTADGGWQIGNLKDGTWDGYIVYIDAANNIFIGRYSGGKYLGDLASANVTDFVASKMGDPAHGTFKDLVTRKK